MIGWTHTWWWTDGHDRADGVEEEPSGYDDKMLSHFSYSIIMQSITLKKKKKEYLFLYSMLADPAAFDEKKNKKKKWG